MIAETVDSLWKMIRADRCLGETKWTEKTITFDYTLPKHILYGFPGYEGINMPQYCAFMMPHVAQASGDATTSTRPASLRDPRGNVYAAHAGDRRAWTTSTRTWETSG